MHSATVGTRSRLRARVPVPFEWDNSFIGFGDAVDRFLARLEVARELAIPIKLVAGLNEHLEQYGLFNQLYWQEDAAADVAEDDNECTKCCSSSYLDYSSRRDLDIAEKDWDWSEIQYDRVRHAIKISLPLIYEIDLTANVALLNLLLGAMNQPCLSLMRLRIQSCDCDSHTGLDENLQCHTQVHIAPNIFGRTAPKLTNIVLNNVVLPPQPVPSFSAARSLVFQRCKLPSNLQRYFPRLDLLTTDTLILPSNTDRLGELASRLETLKLTNFKAATLTTPQTLAMLAIPHLDVRFASEAINLQPFLRSITKNGDLKLCIAPCHLNISSKRSMTSPSITRIFRVPSGYNVDADNQLRTLLSQLNRVRSQIAQLSVCGDKLILFNLPEALDFMPRLELVHIGVPAHLSKKLAAPKTPSTRVRSNVSTTVELVYPPSRVSGLIEDACEYPIDPARVKLDEANLARFLAVFPPAPSQPVKLKTDGVDLYWDECASAVDVSFSVTAPVSFNKLVVIRCDQADLSAAIRIPY